MRTDPVKIIFLVPYPMKLAPSQRFRVELFLPWLSAKDIEYDLQSFIDEKTWATLYQGGNFFQKLWGITKGFARRWKLIFLSLRKYDFVFIHREAAPVGPPIYEWIISKIFRKKIIYDFDDAIWIPNTSQVNKVASWFKAFWKVKYICRWSYKVVGGNDFLCNYALRFNKSVVRIPTCVDVVNKHNQLKDQHSDKVVIGWTGSQSTLKFLNSIIYVIKELSSIYDFEFLVIADKSPAFDLPNMRFIKWKEESEVEDLLNINIGIMPLDYDPWCEGKCGFKLIQYLSLGIPAVASPVGVNTKIIEHGANGYLCMKPQEWIDALKKLLEDDALRKEMGEAGRNKIIEAYSIQANAAKFVSLFDLYSNKTE